MLKPQESSEVPQQEYSYCQRSLGSEYAGSMAVLICLNSESLTSPLLQQLWESFSVRIMADGAANRLHSWRNQSGKVSDCKVSDCKVSSEEVSLNVEVDLDDKYIPEFIKGDLDSLSAEADEYYRARGTKIVHSSCQDTNDFEKCIDLALDLFDRSSESDMRVVVIGAFGGRLDHELSHYHVCYKAIQCFRENTFLSSNIISGSVDLITDNTNATARSSEIRSPNFSKKSFSINLVSSSSIAIVLGGGAKHMIHVPFCFPAVSKSNFASTSGRGIDSLLPPEPNKISCGLLPLFGEVSLETAGLKWNLEAGSESLKMGKFISSSNSVLPPNCAEDEAALASLGDRVEELSMSTTASTSISGLKSVNVKCDVSESSSLLCRCRGRAKSTRIVSVFINNPEQAVLWTCENKI